MKIDSIQNIAANNIQIARDGAKVTDKSFGEILNNAINEVDTAERNSVDMIQKLATGEINNVHEVFIASQKVELTLNMAIEVKNRVIDAYKEIMRLQF